MTRQAFIRGTHISLSYKKKDPKQGLISYLPIISKFLLYGGVRTIIKNYDKYFPQLEI